MEDAQIKGGSRYELVVREALGLWGYVIVDRINSEVVFSGGEFDTEDAAYADITDLAEILKSIFG